MDDEAVMAAIAAVKAVLLEHGLTISAEEWTFPDGTSVVGLMFSDGTHGRALVVKGEPVVIGALIGPAGLPADLVGCGPLAEAWVSDIESCTQPEHMSWRVLLLPGDGDPHCLMDIDAPKAYRTKDTPSGQEPVWYLEYEWQLEYAGCGVEAVVALVLGWDGQAEPEGLRRLAAVLGEGWLDEGTGWDMCSVECFVDTARARGFKVVVLKESS